MMMVSDEGDSGGGDVIKPFYMCATNINFITIRSQSSTPTKTKCRMLFHARVASHRAI